MKPIPIDSYLTKFKKHLDINERVILSAKFGNGKTYYLDKFKEKYKEEYFFITLYPVNYSVSDNSDIFEYIKRDIILQLSEKEEILLSVDFEAMESTLFSIENIIEVFSFLLSSTPEGALFQKLLKKGVALQKKYDEKKVTYNKFTKIFTNQKGGIYERDGYTKFIEKAVEYIKTKQKVVLIIEDLDRIDPAHLFRILNVLGAHIDCKYRKDENCETNKFGINNIITVFDYDITKNIFHHFYGINANYEGYINKFKINNPFYYSIDEVAKDYLVKFIEEKCHVSVEYLKVNSIKKPIYSYIDELSVRDIQNVLNNIEYQIIKENICNNTFSSISPLTIFIAILIRIGVRKEDVKSVIIFSVKDLSLFNLLNTFLLFDTSFSQMNETSKLVYKNKAYRFTKDINEETSIVDKLLFVASRTGSNESDCDSYISKMIDSTIQQALNYVSE